MNFLELKTQLRDELWFQDEAENLVAAHNNFFQQAMYDLQRAVPCYRFGNKDVYPHCASYFECGLTVIPAPRGEIVEVYTIDKIDPATGLESATVSDDWCSKIFYHPIPYCEMERFYRLCQRLPDTTILSVADSLAAMWWGAYRIKRSYPQPTDEGLESMPILPDGRHYPQASTNAGGRSPGGRFAIYRGRLYIAPYIESTESLVVVSNGIKRKWNDPDFVDDDPKVLQALRLNVAIQHYISYEDNPTKLAEMKAQYGNPDLGQWGALQDLIDECRRETESVQCRQAGNSASAARGFGPSNEYAYWNNVRAERTATCPVGQTGNAVTVVREIGSVGSNVSVDDANSRASLDAFNEATARLVCVTPPVLYSSVAVIGHASCPGPKSDGTPAAEGPSTTASLPAGYATSTVDQATADGIAQAAADALAAEQLVCTFWNKEQTATYHCAVGEVQTGADGTATIAAHTYSNISQSLANADAYAEALRLAKLATTCDAAPPVLFPNTQQQVTGLAKQCIRIILGTPHIFTVSVTVNVGVGRRWESTQQLANAAALAYGSQYGNAQMNTPGWCNQFFGTNNTSVTYNI